jgi:predicted DNA-binding transcriptional regulator AlpA
MDPSPAEYKLLRTEAVALLLNVSPQTLAIWRMKGLGPRFIKIGARAVRYRPEDVDDFIHNGERQHTE